MRWPGGGGGEEGGGRPEGVAERLGKTLMLLLLVPCLLGWEEAGGEGLGVEARERGEDGGGGGCGGALLLPAPLLLLLLC